MKLQSQGAVVALCAVSALAAFTIRPAFAAEEAPTTARTCVDAEYVWVWVEYDGHKDPRGGCATEFATGYDALISAGFELQHGPLGEYGVFIDGIDGVVADFNIDGKFWSYWDGTVNPQSYAVNYAFYPVGASSSTPEPGSVESWVLGSGKPPVQTVLPEDPAPVVPTSEQTITSEVIPEAPTSATSTTSETAPAEPTTGAPTSSEAAPEEPTSSSTVVETSAPATSSEVASGEPTPSETDPQESSTATPSSESSVVSSTTSPQSSSSRSSESVVPGNDAGSNTSGSSVSAIVLAVAAIFALIAGVFGAVNAGLLSIPWINF